MLSDQISLPAQSYVFHDAPALVVCTEALLFFLLGGQVRSQHRPKTKTAKRSEAPVKNTGGPLPVKHQWTYLAPHLVLSGHFRVLLLFCLPCCSL